MSENLELEKQLKLAARTGSYIVGRREVSHSLKGSKLLVWSGSANVPQTMLDESKSLSVPAIKFSGNPVELGRACGIPFRVSVIALKSTGDADLSAFTRSSDYFSGVLVAPSKPETKELTPPLKKEAATKPKKEAKRKEEPKSERKTKKADETEEKKSRTKKTDSQKAAKKEADEESRGKKASQRKKKKADHDEEE